MQGLGAIGNVQLVQAPERKFPGLLIQGDSLASLLEDLEEEAPDSFALQTVREWVQAYKEMMADRGLPLPF